MTTETIPVIDLGPYLAGEPGALDRTAAQLRVALTEIGFYFIVNHGVSREKIRDVFEQVKRFRILHRELSIEHGEVTATMKVRRKQVMENFKAELDSLYKLSASGRGGE